jgi:hypothetical protein
MQYTQHEGEQAIVPGQLSRRKLSVWTKDGRCSPVAALERKGDITTTVLWKETTGLHCYCGEAIIQREFPPDRARIWLHVKAERYILRGIEIHPAVPRYLMSYSLSE